jgi:cytochrome c oxidase assembly factor 6
LDKNNIIDALKDEKAAAKACGEESKDFERDCATAWVGLPFSNNEGHAERNTRRSKDADHEEMRNGAYLHGLGWLIMPIWKADTRLEQVTYFKKWRVQDIQKRARLAELEKQGANKLDITTDFKPRTD